MKNKKLNLNDLKVSSFTTVDSKKIKEVRGGHCFSANMCTDMGAGGGGCFGNDQTLNVAVCD